jgi:hypothetical protein
MKPFGPMGATVKVAANTGSQRAAFSSSPDSKEVRVHNAGSVLAFIEFGDATVVAAAATSIPLPAGAVEVFSVGACTNMAVILGSSTADVYATPGKGL